MVQQELRLEAQDDSISRVSRHEKEGIQVLFVGDPESGKTSIIHTLVHERFSHEVPPKLDDSIIGAEVDLGYVPLQFLDYSERSATFTNDQLNVSIEAADVICIVYVAGITQSLSRVANYWIPTIRRSDEIPGTHRPIVLVANKIDLIPARDSSEDAALVEHVLSNVEDHVEVSAMDRRTVIKLLPSIREAFAFPIAPLFDLRTRTLTKKCRNALTRIFKLNDVDDDDLLNDFELNRFQNVNFGAPLQQDALYELKQVTKQSTVDGVKENAITLSGFLFIHELSIGKGRRDFTWIVLRKYHYDNNLDLRIVEDEPLPTTPPLDDETRTTKSISTSGNFFESSSTTETITSKLSEFSIHTVDDDGARAEENPNASRQVMNAMDFPWLRQNPFALKAGVGITVTTFISFIALRYLSTARN